MDRYASICLIKFVLLAFFGSPAAQENILISDSLAAHGNFLEVDAEYHSGNNQQFSLGDYTIIVDPEGSGIFYTTKEKLMGARIVTDMTKAFSFTVSSNTTGSADVYSEEVYRTNTYYPNAVLENFFIEEGSGTKFRSFASWITLKGDSSTTWTLYVPEMKRKAKERIFEMLLTDGMKFIDVLSVSSDVYFDYTHPLRSLANMPAMGFEFFDDGKSICTVQYDAGAANSFDMGNTQSYGCKAWMDQHLDPKTKLVLAAAMSTILLFHNPYLTLHE